jgi:hypothetical protein
MLGAIVAIIAGLALISGSIHLGRSIDQFGRWLNRFDVIIGVIAIVVGVLELLSVEGIMLILGGLVLAVSALSSIPPLAKLGRALKPFKLIIGLILLALGIIGIVSFIIGPAGRGSNGKPNK